MDPDPSGPRSNASTNTIANGDTDSTGAPLGTYRSRRDFTLTDEPVGAPVVAGSPDGSDGAARFVVQRHRATRRHYDLRLEIGGVLVSWAVPKGPTLDPDVRRLAVKVEDHPIEYIGFEGVIPAGEYGGGDVIVWDRGTWVSHGTDDPAAAVEVGELHFDVSGQKLRGRFVLVRTGDASQWLLFHKHDPDAVSGWDPEDHPRSVLSGRTNEEVARAPDAVWRGAVPAAEAERRLRRRAADQGELDALDSLRSDDVWSVGGREVRVSNLDKILASGRDGGAPITKRDLLRYYVSVAPVLLDHIEDRAVNLHRFPDGVDSAGFWQKAVPASPPPWVRRWHHAEARQGRTSEYLVVDSVASLAWLANLAVIELHPWTSWVDDIHHPTFALCDIDPGSATTWDEVLVLARLHRTALDHLGVQGVPKVTGQRGIQIWIPIEPSYQFDEVARWVEALSRSIGAVVPELVSWTWETAARGGLARLDYTQNALHKTLVAPYSARPAVGLPVSMPITWDELEDPDLRPDRWTVRTATSRLETVGDLAAPLLAAGGKLPPLH